MAVGGVQAATLTGYTDNHSGPDPGSNARGVFVVAAFVDLNDTKDFPSGVTHLDVVQVLNLPPDFYVTEIGFRCTRCNMSGTSAVIGDGADPNGYVDNTVQPTLPYLDFTLGAMSGASIWKNIGPIGSGASWFMVGGVSVQATDAGASYSTTTNHGKYFLSGPSPYVGAADTIDMTFYVETLGVSQSSGVTPAFEIWAQGFKRPTR